MFIHLWLFGHSERTLETSRVTMLEDGTPYQVEGRILVLGTKPNVEVHPLINVQWFWVEEN
jgi:hypothetical protein